MKSFLFFLLFGSFLLFFPFLIPLFDCLVGKSDFFYCARLLLGVTLTLRVPLFGLIFACRYLDVSFCHQVIQISSSNSLAWLLFFLSVTESDFGLLFHVWKGSQISHIICGRNSTNIYYRPPFAFVHQPS